MIYAADELGITEASEEELVAKLRDKKADARSAEALSELVRRGARQVPQLLLGFARDSKADETLRVMAVGALDRVSDKPKALAALTDALEADAPAIAERAARVLGRVGEAGTLESLRVTTAREGTPAARAIVTARRLITYRLGLDEELLPDVPEAALLKPSPDAVELPRESVDPELVKSVLPDLQQRQPGVKIAPDGIVAVTCARSQLWLARNAAIGSPKSLKDLKAKSAVPMVILKRSACPESLSVYAYILTHPGARGSLKVFVMRTGGTVTHFGSGKTYRESVVFSVRALNTSQAYALHLEGRFRSRGRKLEIETARSNTRPVRGQKGPSVPTSDND